MNTVFIVCATIGGTVLVLQFALTLIGLGGDALDVDMPEDIDGFDGDVDVDIDADVHDGAAHTHDTLGLFKILSFRTIVAALAFFGLCGLAAQSADASTTNTMLVAIAGGAVAMVAVYWMMRGLYELQAEGTARIQRTVGRHGSVYLCIPDNNSGSGKIQINLQNRTMEYSAVTSGPELPTGTKVVVVDVVNPNTVEVRRDE